MTFEKICDGFAARGWALQRGINFCPRQLLHLVLKASIIHFNVLASYFTPHLRQLLQYIFVKVDGGVDSRLVLLLVKCEAPCVLDEQRASRV